MRGWATARGYTLLAQPLRAEMRCHAALAERLLAGVNPLLAGAVRLEDRVQMRVALSPQAGLLPACSWHVHLEPVQVAERKPHAWDGWETCRHGALLVLVLRARGYWPRIVHL